MSTECQGCAELRKQLDAATGRLAAVEAERDQYRQRANSAEARMGNYRADNRRLSEARVRVQQRNARLAALEQAAPGMAWVWTELNGRGPLALETAKAARSVKAFLDAVAALDAPSGDPS